MIKFERYVSHDFLIVASVLLLSALFNKTIMNVVGSYEAFAAAATTTPSTSQATVATLKDIADAQSWRTFLSSKSFWFPNLFNLLGIVIFFVWLFMYIFKKVKSPSSF